MQIQAIQQSVTQNTNLNRESNQDFEFKDEGDGIFSFNGIKVDLKDSPLTRRLFEVFSMNTCEPVYREEILQYVYDLNDIGNCSSRLIAAYHHNVVKLMSRARRYAELNWGKLFDNYELCWFKFDSLCEGWHLVRSKPIRAQGTMRSRR